jgi:hypothetical protein
MRVKMKVYLMPEQSLPSKVGGIQAPSQGEPAESKNMHDEQKEIGT